MAKNRRPTQLGKIVRKLRIDAGVTIKEMAKMTGMSSSYISAIEMGTRPLTNVVERRWLNFFRERGLPTEEFINEVNRKRQFVDIRHLSDYNKARLADWLRLHCGSGNKPIDH